MSKFKKDDYLDNDYLEKVPSWIVRWGTSIFILFFILLVIFAANFSYNNIVSVQIEIYNKEVPIFEKAQIGGVINKIIVLNESMVEQGSVLVELQSHALYQDVLHLKNSLDKFPASHRGKETDDIFSSNLQLGSLLPDYMLFLKECNISNSKNNSEFKEKTKRELDKAVLNLKNKIKSWEQTYLVRATKTGKAIPLDEYYEGMKVIKGQNLFSIVALDSFDFVARFKLPTAKRNLIDADQKVLIRLKAYPFEEYGYLQGKIRRVLTFPVNEDSEYFLGYVEIDSMVTNKNKTIAVDYKLLGSADIITEEISLFQRIFYPFKGNKTSN